MKSVLYSAVLALAVSASVSFASAAESIAPETNVSIDNFFNFSDSDSRSEAPYAVEIEGVDNDGAEGKARADIGTLGVLASDGMQASASYSENITVNTAGETGVLQLIFDLDGTFSGGGSVEFSFSTSVDPSDAFFPNDPDDENNPFFSDSRSSLFFQFDPAIGSYFLDDSLTSEDVFFQTSDEQSIEMGISPSTDDGNLTVDTQLSILLAFESGTEFSFFSEMRAFSDNGQTVDFFGTSELVAVNVIDPVTLEALDPSGFTATGAGAGDLVALAAANAGGDPIPLPGAVWLMGAGIALLRGRRLFRQ